MNKPLSLVAASALLLSLLCMGAGPPVANEAQFPRGKLSNGGGASEFEMRGYGRVSALDRRAGDGKASLLELICEGEEQAKLLQAKYLSDLQVSPMVRPVDVPASGKVLKAWAVEGQGMICALRTGKRVYLAAAREAAGLVEMIKGVNVPEMSMEAEVEVPMWLNRWDRFGFRHYYRQWELPPKTQGKDYDILKEFEFAEQNGRNGFVLWANRNAIDTSEGLTNESDWIWALKESAARQLPVGLNIMTGGPGMSWFYNRYRDETMAKMPHFTGSNLSIASPTYGGVGETSWSSIDGKNAELGTLQDIVRRLTQEYPNITSILEPHGELSHGKHDILMEYGPLADAAFRRFLQARYPTIAGLNQAWGRDYTDWPQITVPELASFLGWGPDALDLSGVWKVGYETLSDPALSKLPEGARLPSLGQDRMEHDRVSTQGAPEEWFAASFDDSSWASVTAPGHDRTALLPKRPAVYRRSMEVTPEWLEKNPKVWLYLWDLALATGDKVKVAVNGTVVGQSALEHAKPHWTAIELRDHLKPGSNQISIRLPKGILAYRTYLSPDEPLQYPNLGKQGNARWVDFKDWHVDLRLQGARRGMEMIRQVEPNRPIVLMAPADFADGMNQLAQDFGGAFHDTGSMGAFWCDLLPSIMRGANLPFSVEPGGPADSLDGWKKHFGLYSTEGIQGLDYFIHVGNLLWPPDIKEHFESVQPLVKLIGKHHAPRAEVAALYPQRGTALTNFPWGMDPNTNLGAGYWSWNVRAYLMRHYESDGLTESSFERGDASRYAVIIDTNTSIMDDKLLADITRYVEAGGTFVTFAQTGRHTPTEPDAWPISALTGFRVQKIHAAAPDGSPKETHLLSLAPGQEVFAGDWSKVRANGLALEKVAADAVPLMLWDDGSIAIGMRPVGKGYIVQVGCKFGGKKIFDRLDPASGKRVSQDETMPPESRALSNLFKQILAWRGVNGVEGKFLPDDQAVLLRHFIGNNGLFHVWTLWNQSPSDSVSGNLTLESSASAAWAWDVLGGKSVALSENQLPVTLEPLQTLSYLSPINRIEDAPLAWFDLQTKWWRTPKQPGDVVLPAPPHRLSLDLTKDWSFRPIGDGEDAAPFAAPDFDATGWEKVTLGIWSVPDRKKIKQAILRREFQVPKDWSGDVAFSLHSWNGSTFVSKGRVWIDGKIISDWSNTGVILVNPGGTLTPGSTHTVAVEIQSDRSLTGTKGDAWLWLWPKPESSLDLGGLWLTSDNALFKSTHESTFPGPYKGMMFRRNVEVPLMAEGKNVVLAVDATGPLTGVLINGKWVRRFHHIIGSRFDLNITPWVKFGQTNEIELVVMTGPAEGEIRSLRLDFHNKENYP